MDVLRTEKKKVEMAGFEAATALQQQSDRWIQAEANDQPDKLQ